MSRALSKWNPTLSSEIQQMGRADDKKPDALWCELAASDIEELIRIADTIHPRLPESAEVFAERVKLFPKGCLALVDRDAQTMYGYAISHPICYRQPPALNNFLKEIPSTANQYYIHDLAIVPEAQGCGYARKCIEKLFAIAERFPTTCLVSVYGTAPFWADYGFLPVDVDEAMATKIHGYGDDAMYLERLTQRSEEQLQT